MGHDLPERLMPDAASGGSVRLHLDPDEATVLRRLVAELGVLLSADADDDPVAERLFPRAYQDPDDQRAYTELVGDDLRRHKLDALASVASSLGESGAVALTLGGEAVPAWLAVLTDLRLALGTRLEVTEEKMAAPLDLAAPDAGPMSVLHWLGWLQESILRALPEGFR